MPKDEQVELYNIRMTESRKRLIEQIKKLHLIDSKNPLSQLFDDCMRLVIANPNILKQDSVVAAEKYAFLNYWEEGFKEMAQAMTELSQQVTINTKELVELKHEIQKSAMQKESLSFDKEIAGRSKRV